MYVVISGIVALVLMFFSNICAASYSHFLCEKSGYTCYRVKHRDSWNTLFRDSEQRDLVMRLNRMNTPLYAGLRIAIPNNLNDTDIMDYAPLPKQIPAAGEKFVYVSLNPKVLAWGAYDASGNLQKWGPVSGGRDWCPDENRSCHTITGKFAVYEMGGADCQSSRFPLRGNGEDGGAPMPYCMHFHGGFALHGSYEVPGYNDSHGCVRMFVPDAEWLNHEFMDKHIGTTVIVNNEKSI